MWRLWSRLNQKGKSRLGENVKNHFILSLSNLQGATSSDGTSLEDILFISCVPPSVYNPIGVILGLFFFCLSHIHSEFEYRKTPLIVILSNILGLPTHCRH
ncbi:hypothetical protein VN97_g10845 [Penicillium thymicola]|uniref:Uncharacterized protein n=1 Tax=Penicillium thymicola TaxID=293382 RepID=A0AAI9T872_PENTH|nr:hypothetical protein VN97_g10845 [Penicillium thymicola]